MLCDWRKPLRKYVHIQAVVLWVHKREPVAILLCRIDVHEEKKASVIPERVLSAVLLKRQGLTWPHGRASQKTSQDNWGEGGGGAGEDEPDTTGDWRHR